MGFVENRLTVRVATGVCQRKKVFAAIINTIFVDQPIPGPCSPFFFAQPNFFCFSGNTIVFQKIKPLNGNMFSMKDHSQYINRQIF
jgi:hypothetical protein